MKTVYMVYCTMFEDGCLRDYGTYANEADAEKRKAQLETEDNEFGTAYDSIDIESLAVQ